MYADIDGFTAYVGANIKTDSGAKHVLRALYILRSELDAVLHLDFAGKKVRFVGDCIHGLLVEGTAQTTDTEETISNLTLCAGAMRSSFELAKTTLKDDGTDVSTLGLAIGFEYGPMTVTRLGIRGEARPLLGQQGRSRRRSRAAPVPRHRNSHRSDSL